MVCTDYSLSSTQSRFSTDSTHKLFTESLCSTDVLVHAVKRISLDCPVHMSTPNSVCCGKNRTTLAVLVCVSPQFKLAIQSSFLKVQRKERKGKAAWIGYVECKVWLGSFKLERLQYETLRKRCRRPAIGPFKWFKKEFPAFFSHQSGGTYGKISIINQNARTVSDTEFKLSQEKTNDSPFHLEVRELKENTGKTAGIILPVLIVWSFSLSSWNFQRGHCQLGSWSLWFCKSCEQEFVQELIGPAQCSHPLVPVEAQFGN